MYKKSMYELALLGIPVLAGFCLGYGLGLLFMSMKKDTTSSEDDSTNEVPKRSLKIKKPTHAVALVVNGSLKMGKGKVAAQCGHAIVSLYKKAKKVAKESVERWVNDGQEFVLVSVKTTEDLDLLSSLAEMESLPYYVVADAGRTQIKSGSLTVMAIGPSHLENINKVVGQLPLYL